MSDLSDPQIERLTADLLALRAQLQALLSGPSDREQIVSLDQPIGRVSRIDAIQQQKMAQAQGRRHQLRLRQIDAAFDALRDEEYGECRSCGEDIGWARLKARPEAPFCVLCMEEVERRRR